MSKNSKNILDDGLDLEGLLNVTKVNVLQPRDLIPKEITFTKGAYRKAELIGPIIEELTGRALEWSGFMLAEQGDANYLVRDILIEKGQDISRGIVTIDGKHIAKANEILKNYNRINNKNFYIVGWIHGHGDAALIPSGTDIENFATVTNSVSLNTEQRLLQPLKLIETGINKNIVENKIVLTGDALEDAVVEYVLKDKTSLLKVLGNKNISTKQYVHDGQALSLFNDMLGTLDVVYSQPNVYGFAYFVIMNNNKDKPYASMSLSTEKVITRSKSYEIIKSANINQIDLPDDIQISEDKLEIEIKSNIKLPKKAIFNMSFGRSGEHAGYSGHGPTLWNNQGYSHAIPKSGNYSMGYDFTKSPVYMSRSMIGAIEQQIETYKNTNNVAEFKSIYEFFEMLKTADKEFQRFNQDIIINNYFGSKFGDHKDNDVDDVLGCSKDCLV